MAVTTGLVWHGHGRGRGTVCYRGLELAAGPVPVCFHGIFAAGTGPVRGIARGARGRPDPRRLQRAVPHEVIIRVILDPP